jgi:RNA polymerase sigma-70 factor (ECF subfamily)
MSQEELIPLLLKKDQRGFTIMYDMYSKSLFAVISNLVSDREEAEDVLQEVFVKIWKNIETYSDAKGRLYTWMLNIARNTAIDALRKKKSGFGDKIQSIDNNVNIVDSDKNSSIKDDLDAIKQMSKKLNQEQFEVFNAVYFLGYTQDEVAQMLNLPLGTVKTRCRSAIKNIQKLLGHE